jgi:hypothetical protein
VFVDTLRVEWRRVLRGVIVLALAAGFVVVDGGRLDLGEIESRLGIAAGEAFGPFGQVYGGWEPSLWPAQVAFSRAWTLLFDGGTPSPGAVRWPAAMAGVLAGFLMTRRFHRTFGARASLFAGLCWFGSVALIDRSAGAGVDLIVGLGTIAALDRILSRGTDTIAGLWASFAFLAGGWPPLAVIALATIVIGRREAGLTLRLLLPPVAAAVAWSAWALTQAQPEAWAAALALPLTQKPVWSLAVEVLALGLPWSPLALLAARPTIREAWPEAGRRLTLGWLQVAGACLIVGTLVPGLAPAARLPALAGLAVAAAAVAESVWTGAIAAQTGTRRLFLTFAGVIAGIWVVLVNVAGIFLASAVPYYRLLAIVLIVTSLLIGLVGLTGLFKADTRRGLIAIAAVSVCLKLAHSGYYIPEWNYRHSQGPWGRAIGQWVVPQWPIYTIHTWPHDLAFATEHPIRQLPHPKNLAYQDGPAPRFVLLLDSEFEHWPEAAPPLVKVASFQDDRGSSRVLARTAGPFSWSALVRARREENALR